MPNTFSGLATDIITTEFNSDTGVAPFSQISGWFSVNLGNLNNLLNTCFSGADPEIDNEAQAIYRLMYLNNFYRGQSFNALRGVMNSTQSRLLSVAEADSRFSFVNQKDVAREFKSISDSYGNEMKDLAAKYCMYLSAPRTVVGAEIFPPYNSCGRC